ncbi:Glycosyltransferase involved in cell wall bisynthesis [Octadecabacter temperatus]|uniref:Glycosyl transferase family 2 n=1 Tax=Octadecabacter temperatus TaxID=1458307 RepID=A0A0K0Y6U3_9RHOB|nr:glycosyltransferase [Octadecabacter temperatus]AKS46635.1 Glycosyl transferase family 2 [Octadecabacter temperatus]SIO18243.1 Glycosyltransferase involved in cell wall bisynthesis [Octadecabacter temperatus]
MMLRPNDLHKEHSTFVGTAGNSSACVHILMAVHQGEKYLPQQLSSFTTQTYPNWALWAGIDAPKAGEDQSREILNACVKKPVVLDGPALGVAANFMALMSAAPAGEIWALADQDDVWLPDKLARAVEQLNKISPDTPALYCARTLIADNRLGRMRLSPMRRRGPSFANALVQNIASGNTIVLNSAATQLVASVIADTPTPVIHDWWLYQLITAVGGQVICDEQPVLLYRQHSNNVLGANDCWRSRLRRVKLIWQGVWAGWTDRNIDCLTAISGQMTPQNQQRLRTFTQAREASLWRRLFQLRRSGIYRQRSAAGGVMWLAALFGRL